MDFMTLISRVTISVDVSTTKHGNAASTVLSKYTATHQDRHGNSIENPKGPIGSVRQDSDLIHTAMLQPHRGHNTGADEVLYGRAGLLWAILTFLTHVFDAETREALFPVFEAVPKVVDVIIQASRQGSRDFAMKHGEQNVFPLM
ncbi:hypothetical protein V1508DRAFT_425916 [Lipomyces doorenjongii]|uniref:uncharacterized protein n=1 Tax=Lipomyces doorenjongii TaxID=383834 RepID=UPI0034CDDDB1